MIIYEARHKDIKLIEAHIPTMEELERATNIPPSERNYWTQTRYIEGDKIITAANDWDKTEYGFAEPNTFQGVRPVITFDGYMEPGTLFIFGRVACTVIGAGLAITDNCIAVKQYNPAVGNRNKKSWAELYVDEWFGRNKNVG